MKTKKFYISELFPKECLKRGKVHSQNDLPDGKGYFYVGAKKDGNGVMRECGFDETMISPGNCIVFICNGEGSVGYSLYVDRPFYASGDLILGYNPNLNEYIGMFLVTLLDLERPKYSFGRKYGTHVGETCLPLPVDENDEPDWKMMEEYIKNEVIPALPSFASKVWVDLANR